MRTVLVCVRSPVAAQSVASCAARLGVCSVRTAVSEAEVMARLAEQPAELILADTAVSRPDTVGFTRRVLARDPRAVLLLFGAEDPKVAAAAVAAGARGIIRGDHDPVGTVAKALLLIAAARATADSAGAPALSAVARAARKPVDPGPAGVATAVVGTRQRPGGRQPEAGPDTGEAGVLVPAQRGDVLATDGLGFVPVRLRTPLTEREVQVLRGMAEGKSNAEIGRDLYVAEDTVKTHARRLFRKLGARDRAHAVAVGFRAGVLP
ncbi:MAG: helix-turn-helix transcriptional regulator [Micromonosporaceae bacterium]